MSDDLRELLLEWRCIETACSTCGGSGVRAYGSTATWHGGIGGASITNDVCDRCWGSGDTNRPGVNLRQMMAARAAWEDQQVIEFLSRKLGMGLGDMRQRVIDLAALCDKEAGRRKIPDGKDMFWWRQSWGALGSILKGLAR